MGTAPGTWLCTWLTWVPAAVLAYTMVAGSFARLTAGGAVSFAVASLAAGMPTQQASCTPLVAGRMNVAAAGHWRHCTDICSRCRKIKTLIKADKGCQHTMPFQSTQTGFAGKGGLWNTILLAVTKTTTLAIPTRYIQTKPLQQSVLSHPLSPAIIDEPVSITAGKTGDARGPVSALLLSVACKQVPHRLPHPCPHGNSQPHVAAQRVASACTPKRKRNLKSSSCPFNFFKSITRCCSLPGLAVRSSQFAHRTT